MKLVPLAFAVFTCIAPALAQRTFTTFIDGTTPYNNYYDGFSYSATFSVKLVSKTPRTSTSSPGDEDRVYSIKLTGITNDGRGFYYKRTNKLYSCDQLGTFCNPNDFREVQGKIKSTCSSRAVMDFNFKSVGAEVRVSLYMEDGCQNDDYAFEFADVFSVINNYNQYVSSAIKADSPKSSDVTSTKTTAAPVANIKKTTAPNAPLLENRTEPYSNPMETSSSAQSPDKFTNDVQNATTVINGVASLVQENNVKREQQQLQEERWEEEKFANYSIEGVALGMKFADIPSSAGKYINLVAGSEYDMLGDRWVLYSAHYNGLKIKAAEGLSGINIDKETNTVVNVTKNLLVGGKRKIDDAKALYNTLLTQMKTRYGAENISEFTNPYGNNASLKPNSVNNGTSTYNISLSINDYGPGTEVIVSESFMVNKWYKGK